MKITMITHPTVGQEYGMKKLLHVPTRPRTKIVRSKKISRSCLISFIKSLGLSQEELAEKIRKLKYSRDYSFLSSNDHEQTEKIEPYLRLDMVEAFDHNKKLKVGARNGSQEYVHHVKQSRNRKSDSKKVGDLKRKYKVTNQNSFPKIAHHHRMHEMSCNYYRRGRQIYF